MTTMNRLHNCTNPNQTLAKRVLTVCSAGLLRSPTAANVLHQEYGFNTRACGSNDDYALIVIDPVLVEWADEIVFMDKANYERAQSLVEMDNRRKIVLNIPDKYQWNDKDLREEIKRQYNDVAIMEAAYE